jgi:hypothetical protein
MGFWPVGDLKDEIIHYFTSISKPIKTDTNFEEVLYTAMNLYSLNNENKTNPVSAFYDLKTMPQVKDQLGTTRDVDYTDFKYLTSFLIDELLKEFRNRCLTVMTSKQAELNTLKSFLSELENHFEVGVLTFNYDNVFLSQLNRPTTGFDKTGVFDPAIILKKKWNFIYHIHGSVHFNMLSNSKGLHNIAFKSDLSSRFHKNTSGKSGQTTPESQFVLTSNIIAGYGKSYQIQKNPFYLYFTDFAKKIYEADAFLFAGYGFSDIYVNNVIAESFDFNRKRPVVVVTCSKDKQDPIQYRYITDQWAWNLINCIATDPGKMASKNYSIAPTISDLKTNREFEISKDINRPLSIWNSGFLDACRNPKLIIDELKK